MKYKIGVFGSAEDFDQSLIEKVKELGKHLGRKSVIVITGATSGFPYLASLQAHKNGAEICGYSYELNLENLKRRMPDHDTSIYKKLVFKKGTRVIVGVHEGRSSRGTRTRACRCRSSL